MRTFAPLALAAVLLAACSSGEPSTPAPSATAAVTRTAGATRTVEASGQPTAATGTPTVQPTAAQPFAIETRPSDVQLLQADNSRESTTFFFDPSNGEMLTVSGQEFFGVSLFEGSHYLLLDPRSAQFAPSLLVDLAERSVIELVAVTSPGEVVWRSATTVELSLPPPGRPAQQARHLLDIESLFATPIAPAPFPTHEVQSVRGGELHVIGGDSRPLISIRGPGGSEVSSIEGLLRPPVIAPTEEHLAGLTGSNVVIASAPIWEPRRVALEFPFKETGSIGWSPAGELLLIAASAGVFVIDPVTLETRQVTSHDGEGVYADWSNSGDRILVHERGYGPLDLVDAATLETISSHPQTSVIAEDPAGGDRLLVFGHVCVRDADAFSLHTIDLVTGESERLAPSEAGFWTASWSPDGRYVAASRIRGQLTLIDMDTAIATVLGVDQGLPPEFFPSPKGWADGWLIIEDLGGRDRCFV
jgi:hypothetical protein